MLIDNDLYKFSMLQAVLELYPNVDVEYTFINRGGTKFTQKQFDAFQNKVISMDGDDINENEVDWLARIPFFKPWFVSYLKNFRLNPNLVNLSFHKDTGEIEMKICGKWHETILFEVPLMAALSEAALTTELSDSEIRDHFEVFKAKTIVKRDRLTEAGLMFADFGTRRRFSFTSQSMLVNIMSQSPNFIGTSNVYLAYINDLKAIGTMAHEYIQAHSVLESLNHPNRYALRNWMKVYNADLGIALTDTYGTESFFEDFDMHLAKAYDGVRHDSGNPFVFTDKVIAHYKSLKIDPLHKTIVFSDGLNVDHAIEIGKYCKGKIKCGFGIGTHFTNDFEGVKPLNIVIKLTMCNGKPVVKLSDITGKETGDPEMVKIMKYIHGR